MADTPKSTSILLGLVALGLGYIAWTGDAINLMGLEGIKARQAAVAAKQDTLATLQAQIDSAKSDLARESVEDVQARTEAYRKSLTVLRGLVPEQREVSNILDDINRRAKARGLDISSFVPAAPTVGPVPFDVYSYQFGVVGRYNQVGAFLTDVASLPRIMVPTSVSVVRADAAKSRVFGDTVAMLEARFNVRTYVKAIQAVEDSINGT
jgi:type IV pilus assembly protein PilO